LYNFYAVVGLLTNDRFQIIFRRWWEHQRRRKVVGELRNKSSNTNNGGMRVSDFITPRWGSGFQFVYSDGLCPSLRYFRPFRAADSMPSLDFWPTTDSLLYLDVGENTKVGEELGNNIRFLLW